MHNGFAIALAWPQTQCKRAGAWYDIPLHYLKISKNGYYKVGHAALILVSNVTQECHYFDFGRYHAPHGHGRVRNSETDHDLTIKTKAVLSNDSQTILNIDEILQELYNNPSTHGTGIIKGASVKINFNSAINFAKSLQEKEFIPYGPFVVKGTNCSRFVSSVIQAGLLSASEKLKLKFPLTVSPTPMWNLMAFGGAISAYSGAEKKLENQLDCSEMEIIKL